MIQPPNPALFLAFSFLSLLLDLKKGEIYLPTYAILHAFKPFKITIHSFTFE